MNDDDTINPFDLPYFLTTKWGERHSRARAVLEALNTSDGTPAPKMMTLGRVRRWHCATSLERRQVGTRATKTLCANVGETAPPG